MDAQATGGDCASPTCGFLKFFSDMPDPRGCNIIHKLTDILVLAFCGVICGADGWVEVETFCNAKFSWFRTFLELPGGIPSHDTFGRVFSVLDPDAFEQRFVAWMASVAAGGKLIAIDGKSIRRSFEHAWDKSGMAHLVSAFVAASKMVFAQRAVDSKENEIVAIPRLLEMLDLKGAVVTIDAMGCQRNIARQIVAAGGDYVLALKDNQPTLNRKIRALMNEARLDHFKDMRHRLKSDKTTKVGIKTKRLKAGWDNYYLFTLLTT
jgi:predicted transposase YbfD/YdcC